MRKKVRIHIQTVSIDLFDSLLMSFTRPRIAQSLTLIAQPQSSREEGEERGRFVSPRSDSGLKKGTKKVTKAGVIIHQIGKNNGVGRSGRAW